MKNNYCKPSLILLLLQVQATFCALRCELVEWNPEILQCVAIGKWSNSILPIQNNSNYKNGSLLETSVQLISSTHPLARIPNEIPLETFHKYNWSLIHKMVLKDALIFEIHPDLFVNATSLNYLDLSGNRFLAIGSSLTYLTNVRTVQLTGSGFLFSEGVDEVLRLPNLQTLIISKLHDFYLVFIFELDVKKYFWENIKKCRNLQFLDASQNDFSNFTKFEVCASLVSLNLSHCQIKLSDGYFEGAAELRYLFLSHSGISEVPLNAFEGTHLTHLDLSFNSFTEIPPFASITENRSMEFIAETFTSVGITLTHLNLSHNNINSIDLYRLPYSIEVIDFSFNNISQIQKISSSRSIFRNIRSFYIKNNQLINNHVDMFREFDKIVELDFSFNLIKSIEQSMFSAYDDLDWLSLTDNLITSVHALSFANNKALRVLLLQNNRIKTLDSGILKGLQQLDELDLSNNLLTALPYDFLYDSNLRVLKLSCNRLFYLPEYFISQFNKLTSVALQGNPWKCGCLFQITGVSKLEPKHLVDGDHPSCYVGEQVDYNRCDNVALSKQDYSHWERSLPASGIRC